MISIVTLWYNAPELAGMYKSLAGHGAQIIIVDNGSTLDNAAQIKAFAESIEAEYIRLDTNHGFCAANNKGLARATGDIIMFLNNDVKCSPLFLKQVETDVKPGALYGPSLLNKLGWDYLEGWCIAGRREVWETLNGWDDVYYEGFYWDDNDLCFRAQKAGYKLIPTPLWGIWHYSNYTSSKEPRTYDRASENALKFQRRVETWPNV